MIDGELVVLSGLDLDARQEFVQRANAAIALAARSNDRRVRLDSSQAVNHDELLAGMLATLGRNAQRYGLRVELAMPPAWLVDGLYDAGVADLFSWV